MAFSKDHILSEIARTAAENAGVAVGQDRFATITGIRILDWYGVHWARWSDALREAGLEPNTLNPAIDEQELLRRYVELAIELGHLPVEGDLLLRSRQDSTFPYPTTFAKRIGRSSNRLSRILTYCRLVGGFDNVAAWCEAALQRAEQRLQKTDADGSTSLGYVYLLKHGSRREYKIGRTNNALRRHGEINIELPEKVQAIHVISTDDPAGIEAYWHRRFETKRKNGEWFELNADDVKAFKRRKFM